MQRPKFRLEDIEIEQGNSREDSSISNFYNLGSRPKIFVDRTYDDWGCGCDDYDPSCSCDTEHSCMGITTDGW